MTKAFLSMALAVAVSACGSNNRSSGTIPTDHDGGAGADGGTGTDDGTGPAGDPSPVTTTALAKVSFERDDARAASALVGANGNSLKVTDAAGIVWTLSIPSQPGFGAENVKMTPLSQVSASGAVAVNAGVLFEPDGLMFTLPATLTIHVPLGTPAQSLYLFAGDGSNVWFAEGGPTGADYTVTIRHFSGAGIGPEPTVPSLCTTAKAAYKEAVAEAKTITGEVKVEPPPSIPLGCYTKVETANRIVDVWFARLAEPERSALGKILAAARQTGLACEGSNDAWQADIGPLVTRLRKKISWLMALPKNDPGTVFPIVRAELSFARDVAILTGQDPLSGALEIDITNRASLARDELVRRLKEEHDYQTLGALLTLTKLLSIMGAGDFDTLSASIEKAWRFRLDLMFQFEASYKGYIDEHGSDNWGREVNIQGHGSADLRMTPSELRLDNPNLTGDLTLTIESGQYDQTERSPDVPDYGTSKLVSPFRFKPSYKLSFDPCDPAGTYLGIRSFSPDTSTKLETWHSHWYAFSGDPKDDIDEEGPAAQTQECAILGLGKYMNDYSVPNGGGLAPAWTFTFHPALKNNNAQALHNDFTSTTPAPTVWIGLLSVTLTHTPQ